MGALPLVGGPGERGVGRATLGEQARAGRGKRLGRAGPCGKERSGGGLGRAGAWAGPVWADGLVSGFSSFPISFPFLFLINSNLFEFKRNFKFKLLCIQTKIRPCTSMNAQTSPNLENF